MLDFVERETRLSFRNIRGSWKGQFTFWTSSDPAPLRLDEISLFLCAKKVNTKTMHFATNLICAEIQSRNPTVFIQITLMFYFK